MVALVVVFSTNMLVLVVGCNEVTKLARSGVTVPCLMYLCLYCVLQKGYHPRCNNLCISYRLVL